MNFKEFLKPTFMKIFLFFIFVAFFVFIAKEDACGVGLFFAFCYKAYGFPLFYLVTGQIDEASAYLKTLTFGGYFAKFNNFLFNVPAFLFDIVVIYLLACLVYILFRKKTIEN